MKEEEKMKEPMPPYIVSVGPRLKDQVPWVTQEEIAEMLSKKSVGIIGEREKEE